MVRVLDEADEAAESAGDAMFGCDVRRARWWWWGPSSAAGGACEVCRATLRSVCRLFWNQTVTERSSLGAWWAG